MNGMDGGSDNNVLAALAGLLAKKKMEGTETPDALPFGGLSPDQLKDEVAMNPGPVATTGVNPNNPGPEDIRNKSLFARVSDQMQNQVGQGNVTPGAPSDQDRKLAAVSKLAGSPLPDPASAPVAPAAPIDSYGDDLNDAALKKAQHDQQVSNFISGLLRASNTVGNAASNGRVKVDNSFADNYDKQSAQGVQNINDRRNAKDKDLAHKKAMLELQDEDGMRDPNSPVSLSVREGLKALFPKMSLPDNVSALQLKNMGVNYGTLVAAKEAADSRRDAAELARQGREDTRNDKKEKEAVLSDKQVSTIAEYEKPLKMLDSIISDKANFDTGPLAGRLNAGASWVGLDDSKKSAFRADVGDALAQYIKGISGAAVSESERRALIGNLPTINDNDKSFMTKAAAVKKRLQELKEVELGLFEKQGKNVKNFKTAPETTKEEPAKGKIHVSNGTDTLEIDEADLKDAEADGYKRI